VLLQRSSDEYSCDKEKESPRFQLPNYHELKKKIKINPEEWRPDS
jgi:hypothetical protein